MRFQLTAVIAVALLLPAGCSESPEERASREARDAEAAMLSEARWRLEQVMREPASMETRNLRVGTGRYSEQSVVCGEVNGRNGFGGMTGFQRFVVVGGVLPMVEPAAGGDDLFSAMWREGGC